VKYYLLRPPGRSRRCWTRRHLPGLRRRILDHRPGAGDQWWVFDAGV